jgi:hypothetical protein
MATAQGKSLLIVVVILLVVGVSAVLLFREADSTDAIAPDGAHRVGVRIAPVEYGKRKMPVMVWYPAEPEPGAAT